MSFSTFYIFNLRFAKKFGEIFSKKSLQRFWQNNITCIAKSKIRGRMYPKICLHKNREKRRGGGEVIARVSHSRLQRYNGSARLFMRSHNGSYVRHTVWNWNSGNWSRANNCCVLIGRRPSGKVAWNRNQQSLSETFFIYPRESNALPTSSLQEFFLNRRRWRLLHRKVNRRKDIDVEIVTLSHAFNDANVINELNVLLYDVNV